MASESPELVRSLFGYRTSRVRQILADREKMFLLVQGHAQQAQAKVEELQTELRSVRAKLIEQGESTDAMLTQAQAELESAREVLRTRSEHVEEAESRAAELTSRLGTSRADLEIVRAELETTRAELETTRAELETTRAELGANGARSQAAEAVTRQLRAELEAARLELAERDRQEDARPITATEELSVILEAAERGVSGIMERTRHAYEEQLAHAERERQAIRSEIDRFGDWQAHIEPRVRSIQQSIEMARDRIIRIPQQIQDAVGSMAKAITEVSDSLDRLATLPGPPPSIETVSDAVDQPERRSIDLVRLQDDEAGSAGSDAPPETESRAPARRSDQEDPSARAEDPATDNDPHWVTNWRPMGVWGS